MLDEQRQMLSQDEIAAENDRFFAPIGSTLIDLAGRFNLFLDKYYHDAPCWSLCFSPPQGGFAKIDVFRKSKTTVSIGGVWWVDDYDRGTRSIKSTDKAEVAREPNAVEEQVIASFKTLLAYRAEDWTQIATGYSGFWSRTWTKEQFEQLQQDDRFPVPHLHSF